MTNNFSKELPEDIMLLILPRLYLSNYFRCRAVSRYWLAIIDRAIAGKRCPPSPQLPLLMFRSCGGEKDHCFLSPSEDQRVYKYSNPAYDINKLDCVGSIEGWLIMVDHRCSSTIVNFFLNPISGDKVRLPSQTTIPCGDGGDNNEAFFLSKVIASSAPTNPNSCLVAAICSQGRGLAFCLPTDNSWTLIEAVVWALEDVHDIEIVDGKLYAIATTGQPKRLCLHVFDIHLDYTNSNEDVPHHTYKAESVSWGNWLLDLKCSERCFHEHTELDGEVQVRHMSYSKLKFYLFKDSASNELLMISVLVGHPLSRFLHVDYTDFVIPLPTKRWRDIDGEAFQVFKLEHNSNGPLQWEQVSDLGDRSLFLSKTTKLFIPISTNNNDKTWLGGNHIYFAFGRWNLHYLGVFTLTDNTIQHYTIPEDHSPSRHTPPAWFTPSL